ncbi:MAG: multicopper oxidase domain-containing protein [Actinomycetes bacterium]
MSAPLHHDTSPTRPTGTQVVTAIAALLALLVSLLALGRAMASPVRTVAVEDTGGGTTAPSSLEVDLTEFAIRPGTISAGTGTTITVTNVGQAAHDLTVEGTDVATPGLQPGGTASLSLAGLAPGSYTLLCSVPGHASAGMTGTLTIADDGASDTADMGGHVAPSAEEMLAAMQASVAAFPAETEGVGAAPLEPTLLPDGTKLFELVVDEVRWEVEPGKVVDAVGYNGMVPGPTMRVDVGDRVTIRVVNRLDEEGTSLHPHGLKGHAFELDGVTGISQDPIEPGDTMDHTFVADQESVVTYHSHHMSLHQVPNGLFGVLIVGDYAEVAGVEGVVDEQVMILNDAGNIGFSLNGKSFPATAPLAYRAGDRVIVHYANEGQMAHPMHLHNQRGTVIAKDGYVLPESARYQGDTFDVAPGERLTVVYDMDVPGTWAWHCHILSHVKRADGAMFGMLTAVIVEEST